jgi:hypothetical protein
MSTFTHLIASSIAAGLALAGLTAPAHADPNTITASSVPGVIFEGCTDHPINYSVDPPANASTWSIDFVLQAPDGTGAGSAFVTSSDPKTGIEMVSFCGSDKIPGAYTVTGTYRHLVGSTMTLTPVTPFTFDMRKPYAAVTATSSDKTPRLGGVVKVKVLVTDERPTGEYFGTESAKVLLQRLKGGRWVKVRGAKGETTGNGVAKVTFRQAWKGRTKFRAFANLGYPGRAASAPFVLRTRR